MTEDELINEFPTSETAKDMMSMVSPIYEKSYVGKWIYQVMGSEMGDIKTIITEELIKQRFPETATWGMKYLEQKYGIPVDESVDIEERRRKVIAKRGVRAPINPARYEDVAEEMTGRTCKVVENTDVGTFEIDIYPGNSTVDLPELIDTISRFKQSNKHINYIMTVPVGIKIDNTPYGSAYDYQITSTRTKAGTYPYQSKVGKLERATLEVSPKETVATNEYTPTGTVPYMARVGKLERANIRAEPEETSGTVQYQMTGTVPYAAVEGGIRRPGVSAGVQETSGQINYKMCGAKEL